MTTSAENLSPGTLQRLLKEFRNIQKKPLEGINVVVNEEEVTDVQAYITGPDGTPFEGGKFHVRLVLAADFPAAPPKGFFLTKIFHPNVGENGEICVDTLKRDWKPEYGISHILQVIKCLLIYPNPESALNEEAGRLILEDYAEYSKMAKVFTGIHAKDKSKEGGEASTGGSSTATGKSGDKRRKAAEKKKQEKRRNMKRL